MDSHNQELSDIPEESAVRLRQAIITVAGQGGSRAELEVAARELVAALRDRDHPPEQVLLRIKEVLAEAGLRPGHTLAADGSELLSDAALYRDVISASIRYYFDDGDGGPPGGG